MSIRSQRKEDHLALAGQFYKTNKPNSFDQMHLLRPALPETKVKLEQLTTVMFGKKVAAPFFINAMTGGADKAYAINQAFGKIAAKTQIALALGSASILTKEPEALTSFLVAREEDPTGVVIANLNAKTKADSAQKIVRALEADALQIHLNSVQEIAMPEGERDFTWLTNLQDLRQKLTIPIIIKEVGFGLDPTTIRLLKSEGFTLFDIAGSGGTNFAQIENARNERDLSYLEDLGLPTVLATILAKKEQVEVIVSGGVRQPLDVFKGLALGGKYIGVANVFLQALEQKGANFLLQMIKNWQEELAYLLALYGISDLKQITKLKKYYDEPLYSWLQQFKQKNSFKSEFPKLDY
ncbi:type 2 isopentenyl-diphosphate Delta-isomerase [Lactobacillus sp. ESL0230]|uniref:type 2 isopentenyl-diphosphate Delta-isomerase n=1 Tax=Lactobacillus sp. ESL0230 TaxID=2069353 RepID=UPI000EFBCF13|nr:type 2 isopentenyl-diphosphate Delta-isomerase [Lactobacillus sp. ESL0230]RMC46418.1 type 2 isopentenyl-diphosphate Delta-isomerase [Lactobacillus sp. ESL0230]